VPFPSLVDPRRLGRSENVAVVESGLRPFTVAMRMRRPGALDEVEAAVLQIVTNCQRKSIRKWTAPRGATNGLLVKAYEGIHSRYRVPRLRRGRVSWHVSSRARACDLLNNPPTTAIVHFAFVSPSNRLRCMGVQS
jgi:hypothetical protein